MHNPMPLSFEKPLIELEERISSLQHISEVNGMDVEEELNALKDALLQKSQETYQNLSAWNRVQLARHPQRPYTLDYVNRIFTDFLELHGDRRYSDDEAIVGGFAKLDNQPVMIIGTQKGRETKENVRRNFGCPHPEGYRKALRLMKLADIAKVPIISFIDTPGAYPGIASEERHIGEAIAVNLREMFSLQVPFIAVVIGEGGSGGALGIGCGNCVLVMENAYYSVITPEGCAAILWKDRKYSEKAAEMLRLTGKDLYALGVIDGIIPEPLGGAHKDYELASSLLKEYLVKEMNKFKKMNSDQLVDQRYDRFRKIGKFFEEDI